MPSLAEKVLGEIERPRTSSVAQGGEVEGTVGTKKSYRVDDIAAGREFIESYVTFIHYVEGLYEAASRPVTGHYHEESAQHGGGHHLHA